MQERAWNRNAKKSAYCIRATQTSGDVTPLARVLDCQGHSPQFQPQHHRKLCVVLHACNPSSEEVEKKGLGRIKGKFKDSLGYLRQGGGMERKVETHEELLSYFLKL